MIMWLYGSIIIYFDFLIMILVLNEEDNYIVIVCVGYCDVSYSMDCFWGKRVVFCDLIYYVKEILI